MSACRFANIASASATVVPSAFFDQLWAALDSPAVPSPTLQRRARARRRVDQRSERLAPHHHLDAFGCGVEALDLWLVDHATHAQSMRSAQTFVWNRGDDRVVGYFSLAAHLVVRGELPMKLGPGSSASIPAVMLARLALDVGLLRDGLGGELLWDALTRARAASDIAAARLVVVDAISAQAAASTSTTASFPSRRTRTDSSKR